MTFKRGIWADALHNARLNFWLVLGTLAIFLILTIASDYGYLEGIGTVVGTFVWMYLAIPTHRTALMGGPGYIAIGNQKYFRPFIWRAGLMSAAGIFAILAALPFVNGGHKSLALLYRLGNRKRHRHKGHQPQRLRLT